MKKAGRLFVLTAIAVLLFYGLGAGAALLEQYAAKGENAGTTDLPGETVSAYDPAEQTAQTETATQARDAGQTENVTQAQGNGQMAAVTRTQDSGPAGQVGQTDPDTQRGRYCFDILTKEEQLWYLDMYAIMAGMYTDEPLSVQGNTAIGEQGIDKIFKCVMNDHPELFYVDGYSYTHYTLGDETVKISFSGTYTMDMAERNRRQALIDAAVMECLAGIDMGAGDYEKVKYVYEYLITHTEYNKEAPDNQNICSVFIDRQSVCQGYAKATQYLLEKLGIKAVLVIGSVYDAESHAWNLVQIDGKYYYVDTTWGDASYRGMSVEEENGTASIPTINYDYLCVTTNELLKTHHIDNVVPLPECVATEANYYVREGAYFTAYEEEALRAFFEKGYRENRTDVTLRCSDRAVYDTFLENLIAKQQIFRYLDRAEGAIAYAEDADRLSVTFWLVNE